MVRASIQPLTSSQDEMDAFTAVMLSVELELKKRAFVSWDNALKITQSNSPETIKLAVPPPLILWRNEGRITDTRKPYIVPWLPKTRQSMQSASSMVCRERETEDRTSRLLSQHELDQELLYILWRDDRIRNCIALWSMALSDLQKEAPCEYFAWLMKRHPPLVY